MRVTHFCKGYLPEFVGGMEQVIKEIVTGTSRLGVDVEVICLTEERRKGTEMVDGCKVHFHRTNFRIASTPISVSTVFGVQKLIKNTDVIHYHFPYPFADFIHFAARVRKPSVLTYHSDIVRQKTLLPVYRPLMHRFLSSVDKIVATSPNYLATSEVLSHYREKIRVIPIGLKKSQYSVVSDERMAYWRGRVGQKFFLFVGVLRYYKGLFILLEAAKKSSYPIVVVGAGPLEKELKSIAAREEITSVKFIGRLSEEDKVALLMLCHGVILPSHLRAEAFGVSLLEGAMFGKPLISCEIGTGTSFINVDKDTGLVVRPGDPEALSIAMAYLWDHTEEATAMGARAQERYRQIFTAHKMAQSHVELYDEITGRN